MVDVAGLISAVAGQTEECSAAVSRLERRQADETEGLHQRLNDMVIARFGHARKHVGGRHTGFYCLSGRHLTPERVILASVAGMGSGPATPVASPRLWCYN